MNYAYINGIILNGREDMEPIFDHIILTEGQYIKAIVPNESDLQGY